MASVLASHFMKDRTKIRRKQGAKCGEMVLRSMVSTIDTPTTVYQRGSTLSNSPWCHITQPKQAVSRGHL